MEIRATGTLICGTPSAHFRLLDAEEIRGKLRPIIISETEEIQRGDSYLFKKNDTICTADVGDQDLEVLEQLRLDGHVAKIVLLHDEFTREDLIAIVAGEMENGDEVTLS